MNKSNRYDKGSNIVTRVIGDEVVLVPIKRTIKDLDCIYNLNETGKLIWEFLDGKHSLSQIINMVIKTFDVTAKKAEKDTMEFIKDLEKARCIKSK